MMNFLTHRQVLDRLRISQPTFWRINSRGEGPPRVRLSSQVFIYPEQAFEQWLASRFERPLSQQPAE